MRGSSSDFLRGGVPGPDDDGYAANSKHQHNLGNAAGALRYPPHYITGLGDGNVKKLHNVPPRDDDAYEAYLRHGAQHESKSNHRSRSRQQRESDMAAPSSSSWSTLFYRSNHHDHDDYDPVDAAAPWQLSAFALLGAVVLLSALFLHVLADTAAESRPHHRRNNSRSKKSNKHRKAKSEDEEFGTAFGDADNHSFWMAGGSYDVYDDFSESAVSQPVTTTSTQPPPHQQPASLYYPYQATLRSRTGATTTVPPQPAIRMPGGNSYQNRATYNLNPGGTTTTTAGTTVNRKAASHANSPVAPGRTSRASPTSTARKSTTTTTTRQPAQLSPQKPPVRGGGVAKQLTPPAAYKAPRPTMNAQLLSGTTSSFESITNDNDDSCSGAQQEAKQQPKKKKTGALSPLWSADPSEVSQDSNSSPIVIADMGVPIGGGGTTGMRIGATIAVSTPDGNEEDDDTTENSSFVDVAHGAADATPRRFNGRKIVSPSRSSTVDGDDTPEGEAQHRTDSSEFSFTVPSEEEPAPSAAPEIPFLPALAGQQRAAGGMVPSENAGNIPPRPVPLDDLHEIMESGNVPAHWHMDQPPRFAVAPAQEQPPPPPPAHDFASPSLHHDEKPVEQLINDQDVSSHNSFPENDPRRNIAHVRGNLTEGTNSAASLQGAIDFTELQLIEVIGGGGFGQVWRATWRSTPVAVKVLTGSAQSQKVPRAVLEEFAAEINLLRGMRHPNICLYMGACLQPPNRAIITELAANGSLWDALRLPLNPPYDRSVGRGLTEDEAWPPVLYQPDPRHGMPPSTTKRAQASSAAPSGTTPQNIPAGTWTWALVKRVACGTARGMAYLHSGVLPVLHRDLKSANILLDESYTPKVCDFGLSRLQSSAGASMTGNCGTVQWMAPEVLANQRYNEKADVFSYGIILWELLTRTCPYEGMAAVQCALAVLNRNHRPSIPVWCPPFLHALIRACLKTDPRDRPTFAQILAALESMP